jgi:DNA-binding XRE family transcriptional regulator
MLLPQTLVVGTLAVTSILAAQTAGKTEKNKVNPKVKVRLKTAKKILWLDLTILFNTKSL